MHLPLQDRIADDAHRMRVRDCNRALEEPRFLEPGGASHLTVAVEGEPGAHHWIGIVLAARVNDRDTRPHGTLAYYERAAAGNECRVADLDSRDVCNRVESASSAADLSGDSQIARSGLRGGGLPSRRRRDEQGAECGD